MSIEESSVKTLTSQGKSVSQKAKISFLVSFGGSITDSTAQTEQHEFMNMVRTAHTTTLGGDPYQANDTLRGTLIEITINLTG